MTTPKRTLTPIPFANVHFADGFWAPRIETNRTATLPHILAQLEATGRISAFDLTFERPVPSPIVLIFGDSDAAKWIEAASYALATQPDPYLEAQLEGVIEKVVSAQQPDGYLNTHFIRAQPAMRWKNLRDWHEMYCAGHLIEGAVAHYQATGRRNFLEALCRYADHIADTFGVEPGQKRGYCGHPEIELALIRLYHATGNERYLRLSKYFVDERGSTAPDKPHYYDLEARARGDDPAKFWAKNYEYNQSHRPIREQEKVVGHAVRAVYLLSAVADLAHEYEEASLRAAGERLWENLINTRMYVTGGIGPSQHNEGFTTDYDLPDETAYAETCATIGLVMWNHRLLQLDGDRRYADVIERGLYNGFLSGVSLDGKNFYYENPLSSTGNHHHVPWFDCPCCPPNVARLLASIGQYFYSTGPQDLWLHLYAGNTAQVDIAGQPVTVRQQTRYPWEGAVRLDLELARPQTLTLHLRVPGWCDHYRIAVNGQVLEARPESNGYLALTREWRNGDTVEFEMAMPIQAVFANPAVRQLEGRVAIQRGPVIYCLEGADHGAFHLDQISVISGDIAHFQAAFEPDWLGGVVVIRGQGEVIDEQSWAGGLYSPQAPATRPIRLTAVPYCTWDNRTPGEMRVWLRAH